LVTILVAFALVYVVVRAGIHIVEGVQELTREPSWRGADARTRENLNLERKVLTDLEPIIRQDREMVELSVRDLKDLYRSISEQGGGPGALEHVQDREFLVMQRLDYLKTVDRNLKAFDLGLFHKMKATYESLPPVQRGAMRQALERERAKVFEELDLERLRERARTELADLEASLQLVEMALRERDAGQAKRVLLRAIRSDKRIDRILGRLQRAEHRLLNMIPESRSQTR
jgi:hypothetical protein